MKNSTGRGLRAAYDKFVHERPELYLIPFALWSHAYIAALEAAAEVCDKRQLDFMKRYESGGSLNLDLRIQATTASACARDIRQLIVEAVYAPAT